MPASRCRRHDAAMTQLRILIVDDEPLARLRLRSLIEALDEPRARVAGDAGDADAALAAVQQGGIDLVLLDIRLPGRDGLRLAAALQALPQAAAQAPAVVFVTAHGEHALRAFELDAVDYLTKPVRRERLQEALRRVAVRRAAAAPAQPAAVPPPPTPAMLVVTERGRLLRLPLAEVIYLKADQKYVKLRTAANVYVLDESLSELEPRLGEGFVRIHRNALVARHAVRALELREVAEEPGSAAGSGLSAEPGSEGWAVRVAPVDEWLAVSRRQLSAVRQALAGAA